MVTATSAASTTDRRWADQTWVARVVVVLAVISLAFEQSPANEAVRANLGFRVLEHTGNAIAVGLTVFLITLVIEGVPGVMITGGLHLNPGLARRLMRKTPPDGEVIDLRDGGATPTFTDRSTRSIGSALTDIGIALGVGAGLVVVKRRWNDPHRSVRQDLSTCAKATLVVGVVSGFIGWLVAGGITYADKVGLERPAELVIDYATDWRFWFIVIFAVQIVSWIGGRLKRPASAAYQPKHLSKR